jgi:hypothetical protein
MHRFPSMAYETTFFISAASNTQAEDTKLKQTPKGQMWQKNSGYTGSDTLAKFVSKIVSDSIT